MTMRESGSKPGNASKVR
jgi:hypothetical protein